MTSKQRSILLAGILFLFTGSSFVAFEQWKFSNILGRFVENSSSVEDPAAQREKARADLRKAEEYLRQNSPESARYARDIFNDILSRDLGESISHEARYGLASSLDRLDDRRAALAHLRDLKKQGVTDRKLADNVDYLLGRLLILYGKQEEGKSLLEALLARTTDNTLKSKIHTTFADNYAIRGDEKNARRNYMIALEYNPDNLHAEIARIEDIENKKYFRYEYYDHYMLGRFHSERDSFHSVDEYRKDSSQKKRPAQKEHKKDVKEKKEEKSEKKKGPTALELYRDGMVLHREGKYSEAVQTFEEAIKKKPSEDLLEKILYRKAQSMLANGDENGALAGFEKVLENKDLKLDQAAYVQRGIIYFDRSDFQNALKLFSRAVSEFPAGEYTDKAARWKKETENQIRDQAQLEEY